MTETRNLMQDSCGRTSSSMATPSARATTDFPTKSLFFPPFRRFVCSSRRGLIRIIRAQDSFLEYGRC